MHRRLLCTIILTASAWLAAPSASAPAGDWMFRSSYYSHDVEPGEVNFSAPTRTSYREPWVGAHPHSAVRSGWRVNSFVIHNGSSTDQTFFRENWYDVNY
jgi:hypothetical protein